MSYQVLARKYRPASFKDLEGQEHVLQALINALDNERLRHAYLFTGTRGVGKTTIARILARCLNCETGITSTPCGECNSCREISEGRSVDLIEVDAASRTGVDDMRELLDNEQRAAQAGNWFLKPYLESLVDTVQANKATADLERGAALALVYQLLGAAHYFAVSQPTLTMIFGAKTLGKARGCYEDELRTLIRSRLAS